MSLPEFEQAHIQFYEQYTAHQNTLANYCRNRFLEQTLNKLPPSSQAGIEHLLNNKFPDIFGTHRVLGGYLAPWSAETLGIEDQEITKQATFATFLGRFWFILWDYQMDEPGMVTNIEEATQPLQLITHDAYKQLIPKKYQGEFESRYNFLLKRSKIANALEMKQRNKTIEGYSKNDLRMVGQKIAVVNWTTYALAYAAERPFVGERLARVMDNIFTAIQLNHDITDVEEDWTIGNCTYPISLALKNLSHKEFLLKEAYLSLSEILNVVNSNKMLFVLLNTVNYFAENGVKESETLQQCPFRVHLQAMIDRNKRLLIDTESMENEDRRLFITETLKRNQGHPQRHGIIQV